MKREILKIFKENGFDEYNCPYFKEEEITNIVNELDALFAKHIVSRSFICVSEQTPPENVELLVQDSYGNKHLTSWRKAYSIFSCQNKTESAEDWLWTQI